MYVVKDNETYVYRLNHRYYKILYKGLGIRGHPETTSLQVLMHASLHIFLMLLKLEDQGQGASVV